ncbi:MAG: 30S ribosomal protein S1 [Bdellovibrionota bacterium]|nr:MAG: 30S ribosomal protein S1 [Bdellovibrionota bacterium]
MEGNYSESSTGGGSSFAVEFEKLLKERSESFRPGKVVRGTVVGINKDYITVDIGFKTDGIIRAQEFHDAEGNTLAKLGEVLDVFIISLENESGQLLLSKEKAEQKRVWEYVEDIYKKNGTIKGVVVQKVKGGLQVDIGIPAFLPGSQIDIRPQRNLDKFIGQTFEFKVLKITRDKGNIVLSRRAVLMNEREEHRSATLKVLAEGVVMEGTVKNITDFGAFVDLGGIDGLLHISDITWGRINHPSEKLSVGQVVPVVVLKYEPDRERVSLGMKQLKADPWLAVHERFPVGSRVKGKVMTVTDYGAFLELEEGVEGLIHVSEMSWSKKNKNPSKIVTQGEQIEAVVLGIDADAQRISLGMKQLLPNPWDQLRERHPIGSRVTGKVRSITDFGIFIGVDDGIDGLVHVSDFSWTKRIKDPKEIQSMFKKGDDVEAVVLDINAEDERLSLGIKQLSEDPWGQLSQRYPVGSRVKGKITSITDFGVFIEIEDGIEGLVHNSQLGIDKGEDVAAAFPIGNVIESEVVNVDRDERRISLSVKALKRRDEKEELAEYMEDASSPMTFGDLLRQKMDSGDK